MPAWVDAGFEEYAKRVRGRCELSLREIAAVKRGKNADVARIRAEEGEKMLAAMPDGARVVALDLGGKDWSSEGLSEKIDSWMGEAREVVFVVGGPEGLSEAVLARADQRWRLSALTFSHPVVRVVWAEAMYRGWSISEGLPYHR